jgi:hypothetical protein
MPELVSDLDRVIVTNAIREVMAWYAYYADHGQWDRLAQLFTPAATFTSYGPGGELYLYLDLTGPAAIEKTIAAGVGNARAIHHLFSYTADVRSPAAASIVVNMEDWITPPADDPDGAALQLGDVTFRSVRGYGHYRCDLVKADDGWKISKLEQTRLRMDFEQ